LGFVGLWTAFAQSSPDLASVDKVGWWTRRPGAMPTNNPNNFEVAAGVQGDESIAALRVLIRGDITKATLVMGEVDAPLKDVSPGKLKVCTTTVPWIVADGGAYDAAPKPDCSGVVELTRTKDANGTGAWAGDITKLVAGARSEVTLMVLPSADPAAVVPPTYFIKFLARIDAEGTPDVKPSTPTTSAAPVVNTPPPRGATSPTGSLTPATTAPPQTTIAPASEAAQPRRFEVATAAKSAPKPWGKLFLLIPLSAIGAALYTGGRKFWADRLETATS
jgi:hypothetical protein